VTAADIRACYVTTIGETAVKKAGTDHTAKRLCRDAAPACRRLRTSQVWSGFEPASMTSGCWFIRRYWPGVMPYSRRNWRLKLERF
jgi:hypothetical protein